MKALSEPARDEQKADWVYGTELVEQTLALVRWDKNIRRSRHCYNHIWGLSQNPHLERVHRRRLSG